MRFHVSRGVIAISVTALVLGLVTGAAVSLLIHRMGDVIRLIDTGSKLESYALILDQLQTAELELPGALNLIGCILWSVAACRIVCGKKDVVISKKSRSLRVVSALLGSIVAAFLIMSITLWFTEVNGIRFGTAAGFLYNAIQNGVL